MGHGNPQAGADAAATRGSETGRGHRRDALERPQGDVGPKGGRVILHLPADEPAPLGTEAGVDVVQEAGLERGEPVDWECADGGCGVCVMGIVDGADQLEPPMAATGEMRTIQVTEQVVPDPTQYRFACLARVRGTARLRNLN